MRQQLLEGEALLRRVAAGGELGELRFARRPVQVVERLGQRSADPPAGPRSRRNEVAQRRALELPQRLGDERAQPPLRHALGERIDRRERLLERGGGLALRRRYSGCTISRPSGPRRTSPKQRSRVPRARLACWLAEK